MAPEELRRFFSDNPRVYGGADPADLRQLAGIHELYPGRVRLLSDADAVELPLFECRRCGACCAAVKYVTVCHEDIRRWVSQKRLDILGSLAIDRRRTPLLAAKKGESEAAKAGARAFLLGAGMDSERAFELLFITALLECAVYVKRRDGACAFLEMNGHPAACAVHDTKPRVCEKFPFYTGKFTDGRLLREDSFCPALRALAKKE